jgi:hypothetical protein
LGGFKRMAQARDDVGRGAGKILARGRIMEHVACVWGEAAGRTT